MPRWMIFLPVIALVAAAAVLGLTLGRKAVRASETEVIARIAARYVAEMGGTAREADCTARPAASQGLWMVVTCLPKAGPGATYFIDSFGAVAHREDAPR